MDKYITIKGAKEHNLKNIDVKIPKNNFVVFTGVSGSGKSSLAFDTIYAEGQRRYIESLSSYARQFLGQIEKPHVDSIEGLSPSIAIDQKTTNKNPRSTVGTITEILDYLRLLYASIGVVHCPKCGKVVEEQGIEKITFDILKIQENSKILILSPIIKAQKGQFDDVFGYVQRSGFSRVMIDGEIFELPIKNKLSKNKTHDIDIVIDRLVIKQGMETRVFGSVETALSFSPGIVKIKILDSEFRLYSQRHACANCNISVEKPTPKMFSFNTPYGACSKCMGLGLLMKINIDLLVPDKNLSINQNAIVAIGWNISTKTRFKKFGNDSAGKTASMYFNALSKHFGFSLDTSFCNLPENIVDLIMYGTGEEKIVLDNIRCTAFEGIINNLERRFLETNSAFVKTEISKLMIQELCDECSGARFKSEVLSVTISEKNIDEVLNFSISKILDFFKNLSLSEKEKAISKMLIKEIQARVNFLIDVGLDYLTLSRSSQTLSGGELQRIRLASQIGSGLSGVLYVLDEPSIGLHQRDNDRLIEVIKKLKNLGNTLIVVEHDEDTIYAADYIVDFGPFAGVHGGEIICKGNVDEIKKCENSQTGLYLSGRKKIEIPKILRDTSENFLEIFGAKEHNLKNINVKIPIGAFTAVTGVSGSGKSTLINEILYKALFNELGGGHEKVGKHEKIIGIKKFEKVIVIDQTPIGRTPRSNPATYTGIFGDIREIFANTNDARALGYTASKFSFNVKGGRCETCFGDGTMKIEMHFLPDVYVECECCKGMRYNFETLKIKYKNKNIFEVLQMNVEEAIIFFENIPKLKKRLTALSDIGLGYIKLGQSSTTLSGGEAQRIKLANELSKRQNGKTIYILDEPTTGLHMSDVHKLIEVLQKLVDSKNTVLVIEHNLSVIKVADYVIDLGPEGGENGGQIVAVGSPLEISKCENSYTGKYLKKFFS